jgi:probable biosynthetic protein (TIGR04098 family)
MATAAVPAPCELLPHAGAAAHVRRYVLGMPQMLFGGLSENWLLKECGDVHWQMVCADLGQPSAAIASQDGERLYASFTRIRMEMQGNLRDFSENEPIDATASLSRFGDKRYFSSQQWAAGRASVRCLMNSVFISRETDNRSLARSRPRGMEASTCHSYAVVPPFGQGYQLFKAWSLQQLPLPEFAQPTLAGYAFAPGGEPVFTCDYAINPYHDLNGVNLLYFASYPRIHDICERRYGPTLATGPEDWALATTPIARDLYYYGNADIADTLRFELYPVRRLSPTRLGLHSALFRSRDGVRMADLFTVKDLLTGTLPELPE